MKVAFLLRSLGYGGAERQAVALAKGLHARGHMVTVAVFYASGPFEQELYRAGVAVRQLGKRARWDVFAFLWRAARFVREERPDVVHGYLVFPNILTLMLRLILPGARAAWGVRATNMDPNRLDWLERIIDRVQCRLSRFADLIIVNSRAGLNDACSRGFPREKMVLVPNGIDTEFFRADEEAGRELRVAWRVKNHETLIGIVGRLDPMKDHPTFLKAAAALARKHDDLRFVCVGDGPQAYRTELIDLGERLGLAGRIEWARARADMPVVYSALDIHVSSSSYGEGFSNVIAEAMSCGVPCVVTDVGDSAWIAGESGEVAPPADASALASAIEKSLKRIRAGSDHRERSRQRIVDLFSVPSLVVRTEQALCGSSPPMRVT